MVELAGCVMVFYLQKLGTCFVDTGVLVWRLLSLEILKPSLLHLISSQAATNVLCCLVLPNEMVHKGYIDFPYTSCHWKVNGFSFVFFKMTLYCLWTAGIVTKTLVLEHFRFLQHSHEGGKYKCYLHFNKSHLLIMIGEDQLHVIEKRVVQE